MVDHVAEMKNGIKRHRIEQVDATVKFWEGKHVHSPVIGRTIAILTIGEDANPYGLSILRNDHRRDGKKVKVKQCLPEPSAHR
jgi:hypothetical protein